MPAKGQRTGYIIKCENCGKEVYKTKSQYNKAEHHFCCVKCQKEYEHKRTYEDRKCEVCGKIFNVSKKSTQRFCSQKCQSEWQKTNVGSKNPRFEGETVECDWCHKLFDIGKFNYDKFDHHFCCAECRQKWYSNIFSQSDEWRDVSRKRATKILSDKKIDTNTRPQVIINELLDDMNISYRNEENFIYYSIDNYLPDYDLVIEVMGDFWHCSPIKYPDGYRNETQRKRIPKDKAKHTYMKNQYNIDILYLWESDIYNRLDVCMKLIELYIQNNGVLNNYNSFNYHIEDDKLKLNTEIIYPYFEIKSA